MGSFLLLSASRRFLRQATSVARVDEFGRAEPVSDPFLGGIRVDSDDPDRSREAGALYRVETDAAHAEHGNRGTWLHAGSSNCRADTGSDAAGGKACTIKRRILAYLGHRRFQHDRMLGEGAGVHESTHRTAAMRKR